MNYRIREQTQQQFIIVDTSIVYMDGKEIKDAQNASRGKDKKNVSKLCIFKSR
jgi:hypothetical protein